MGGEELHVTSARLTEIIPFFLRVGHKPISRDERDHLLKLWSEGLGRRTADLTVSGWKVEPLSWREPDPAGMTRRRGVRLVADLDEALLFEATREAFSKYADVVVTRGPCRIVYEDHGVGCLELTVDLHRTDGVSLLPQLVDEEAWSAWSDLVIEQIDGGHLGIQEAWPSLRSAFHQTIGRTHRLEGFDSLRPAPAEQTRDDLCDVYGNCLIIAHAPATQDVVVRDLMRIARAVGSRSPRCFGDTPDDVAILRDEGLSGLVFHDYGTVAAAPTLDGSRGQSRVLTLTRYVWMSYASLAVAAEGLQARIAAAVAAYRSSRSKITLDEETERLTQITGVLALIRYDALSENFVADEFEKVAYGGLFNHWNMSADVSLLDRSIEDATRTVTGLSSIAAQKTGRFVDAILSFIAGLTLVSVLQDGSQFIVKGPPEHHLTGTDEVKFLILVAIFVGLVLIILSRIGFFRWAHHLRR